MLTLVHDSTRAGAPDEPAPISTAPYVSGIELRVRALDALMDLGADYVTAARAVASVIHAVQTGPQHPA